MPAWAPSGSEAKNNIELQTFESDRIMIMAAPNGARRTRSDHPALPVTAAELASNAGDLVEAGASVLHLHVRNNKGQHTLAVDAYRDAIKRIRRETGEQLILQITTEAVGQYTPEEQMSLVRELHPEAVSLALTELCPDERSEAEAAVFFAWLIREGIWPQYILYSVADLLRFEALHRRGLFSEQRPSCLLVLGRYSQQRDGHPAELQAMLSSTDCRFTSWSVCCFGAREQEVMLLALEQGGHARIGFENNLLLADGRSARDNAALIAQFAAVARQSERQPASADEVRRWRIQNTQGEA